MLKNLNVIKFYLILFIFFFVSQTDANAYFGPAIGLGLLAIMLLFLLSIIIAIIAIFYSPTKKLILKIKNWKK